MDASLNGPINAGRKILATYFFEGNGSSAQTVYEGQGVCFNSDYGTATESKPERHARVELPSSGNKIHFAGVLAQNYSIPADGRFVQVYEPGSVCNIRCAAGQSATVNSTLLECTYTAGTWKTATNTAKGVADALQSITGGSAALLCLAYLRVGDPCVGLAD